MTVGKHTAEQIFAIVKNLAYIRDAQQLYGKRNGKLDN